MQTNGIQTNIENAEKETKEMQTASDATQDALREGADLIAELKEQATQTAEINRATRTTTEELDNRIKEVEVIIGTILSISDQTNLLALNASIESARAGESGKGFAVVADEVRNLASKSAEASQNTAALISKTMEAVENGSEIANQTAESLHTVVNSIDDIVTSIDDISKNSQSQSEAIEQVTQGVEQLSTVTQNNSAASEQSAAAAEELAGQANTMKSLVGRFTLHR